MPLFLTPTPKTPKMGVLGLTPLRLVQKSGISGFTTWRGFAFWKWGNFWGLESSPMGPPSGVIFGIILGGFLGFWEGFQPGFHGIPLEIQNSMSPPSWIIIRSWLLSDFPRIGFPRTRARGGVCFLTNNFSIHIYIPSVYIWLLKVLLIFLSL